MTSSTLNYTPAALGRMLVDHWVRWLLPAMFVAAAAVVYALYYRADWEAVQALIVRNEAAATHDAAPGKFRQPEDMKTVQETILELVKGRMVLSAGGAKLAIAGKPIRDEPEREYPALYERFAEIIRAGISDADLAPLQHVADAFMLGKRNVVDAFHD